MRNAVPALEAGVQSGGIAEQAASRAVAARLEAYAERDPPPDRRRAHRDAAYRRASTPASATSCAPRGCRTRRSTATSAARTSCCSRCSTTASAGSSATSSARMARVEPGTPRVRAWIEGVLEQARNDDAAANTRPFTSNAARLADRFPEQTAHSRELVVEPLRDRGRRRRWRPVARHRRDLPARVRLHERRARPPRAPDPRRRRRTSSTSHCEGSRDA